VIHAVTAQLVDDERGADRQIGPAEVEGAVPGEQQGDDLALLKAQ
jgi:hypothetical protein